jgi:DNA-binding response OmpR family regulator
MSNVLLLTGAPEPPDQILPSLSLLPHVIWAAPPTAAASRDMPPADLVLIDARRDLVQVRQLLRLLRGTTTDVPVLVVVAEGGWAGVSADWGADDVILNTAGPGEVDARLRIALARAKPAASTEIRSGDLAIDEVTYSARVRGRALELTFKEFELLKFLAASPGRVFTRSQLLQEVWGYDYFGGTRTVDVHVRRLRAKLGGEHEALIGTVRNVGYRFVPLKGDASDPGEAGLDDPASDPDPDVATPGDAAPVPTAAADVSPAQPDQPAQPAPDGPGYHDRPAVPGHGSHRRETGRARAEH